MGAARANKAAHNAAGAIRDNPSGADRCIKCERLKFSTIGAICADCDGPPIGEAESMYLDDLEVVVNCIMRLPDMDGWSSSDADARQHVWSPSKCIWSKAFYTQAEDQAEDYFIVISTTILDRAPYRHFGRDILGWPAPTYYGSAYSIRVHIVGDYVIRQMLLDLPSIRGYIMRHDARAVRLAALASHGDLIGFHEIRDYLRERLSWQPRDSSLF